MIVRGDIKKYIGAVESEEIAARFYDKYALIIQGFEVSSRLASQLSSPKSNQLTQSQKNLRKVASYQIYIPNANPLLQLLVSFCMQTG